MATISRTWKFNGTITHEMQYQQFPVEFVANGKSYEWMLFSIDGTDARIFYGPSVDAPLVGDFAYCFGKWSAGCQTVNFGAPQNIDDSLYNFIVQNAVEQEETEFEIDILSNGTKTLKTKGKYCDRDIHVNVRVSGSTAPYVIPAGTYQAGNIQLQEFEQDIRFTSNGTDYTGMWMIYYPESQGTAENPDPEESTLAVWILSYVYGSGSSAGNVYKYWPSKGYGLWTSEADMTITVPERQEVSAAFLDWFTRSFAGIAPETVPEYDGTVTVA